MSNRHWMKNMQNKGDTLSLDQKSKSMYEIYIKSLVIRSGLGISSEIWIRDSDRVRGLISRISCR